MAIAKFLLKKLRVIKDHATSSSATSSPGDSASNTASAAIAASTSLPPSYSSTGDNDLLHRVFSEFDKDGDGRISTAELERVARAIGTLNGSLVEADSAEVMAALDLNGDGSIDFHEFKACLTPAAAGLTSIAVAAPVNDENCPREEGSDVLRSAFAVYDRNGDGVITAEELQLVLAKLMGDEDNATSLADCKKMIRAVDKNDDGVVSFDEFVAMMTTRAGIPVPTVLVA